MFGKRTLNSLVPGFWVLGFSALPGFKAQKAGDRPWKSSKSNIGNRALPGFRALLAVDGPSALNPGTTVIQKVSNSSRIM